MLNKLWRYSHFYLTVSSSLFLLLATITGAFLAFEPITEKLQPHYIKNAEDVSIAQLIITLNNKYEEVLEVEVDKNYFVNASVFSMDEALDGQFYINPINGNKIADIPPKSPFFEFLTNFHRSLFLKTTGRVFVGIISFLLFLISITGLLLAIKRQGGIIQFCSKIINDKSIQYNHVALGRLFLIPILILALSGTYLSMDRFSLLPKKVAVVNTQKTISKNTIPFSDFPIFKNTTLKEIKKLEFPFSTDEEDFFILNLHDKELKIHQKTGEIVETTNYPFTKILSELSFNLHTGSGSIIWSLVLFTTALSILYFMYSGSIITLKRLRSKTKNKYKYNEANYIILVGSENGTTKGLAKVLQKALLKADKKVYVDDLNNYKNYPNIQQLIIITSTYGQGEPPSNANLFLSKLHQIKIDTPFTCHVIGLGSYAYPKFCEFAKDIQHQVLLKNNINVPTKNPLLIHNQDYAQFKNWALQWANGLDLNLELPKELSVKKQKEIVFKVVDKQNVVDEYDETFRLTLKAKKHIKFTSGDLLGITPPNETSERLYSIGKDTNGNLLLSIKKHTHGICSNYLNNLIKDQELNVTLQTNKAFHLPKKSKQVILIANGTGIAPFLGMMEENIDRKKMHMYWGAKTTNSFNLYKEHVNKALQKGTLTNFKTAYSRNQAKKIYVQNLIKKDKELFLEVLKDKGCIMICGSIAMQKEVIKELQQICTDNLSKDFSYYQNRKQIKMDCY